jgi:hypothetical protein
MKSQLTFALVLTVVPIAASADYVERYRTYDGRLVERVYVDPPGYVVEPRVVLVPRITMLTPLRGTGAIHTGGGTLADHALADRIGIAIAEDPALKGVTATIVVNGGNVSLSGSAPRQDQAQRAENIAREIAGFGNVSGTLDSQGAG